MKQIAKTGKVLDRLRAAVGPDADIENLAVFEATALNQLPLRKKQPLYNGAVASLSMLRGMADKVNAESLPLDLNHLGSDTPSGRVFHGELVQGDGGPELRTLFFVSDTAGDLVANLDNGTIDQVSVGVLPKQILCSSCGWDYRGADATFLNLLEGVCANDHAVGDGGVHTELVGVDDWYELSLVSRGGAHGARVAGPSTAKLTALAASGVTDPHVLCLHASITEPETPVPPKQNEGAESVGLLTLANSYAEAKAETITLKASVDAAKAENETLKARVAELEAAAAPTATAAELETRLTAALEALQDLAREGLVQLGHKDPQLPEDPAGLVASIKDSRERVAAILEGSGRSRSADSLPAEDAPARGSSRAFSTPPKR